jgi:hypothetical protein
MDDLGKDILRYVHVYNSSLIACSVHLLHVHAQILHAFDYFDHISIVLCSAVVTVVSVI